MPWLRGVPLRYLSEAEGVAVRCGPCARTRVFTLKDLRVICGDDRTLDPLRRLTCLDCGEAPNDLWITWPSVITSTLPKG